MLHGNKLYHLLRYVFWIFYPKWDHSNSTGLFLVKIVNMAAKFKWSIIMIFLPLKIFFKHIVSYNSSVHSVQIYKWKLYYKSILLSKGELHSNSKTEMKFTFNRQRRPGENFHVVGNNYILAQKSMYVSTYITWRTDRARYSSWGEFLPRVLFQFSFCDWVLGVIEP